MLNIVPSSYTLSMHLAFYHIRFGTVVTCQSLFIYIELKKNNNAEPRVQGVDEFKNNARHSTNSGVGST